MPEEGVKTLTDDEIVELIRKNELSMSKTIESLYWRSDLRKIAFKIFRLYQRNLDYLSWEDVYFESLIRLVISMQQGRFEQRSKVSSYYKQICRNYCSELVRKNRAVQQEDEENSWVVNPERLVISDEIAEVLRTLLQQQSEKCLKMFELLFFYPKAWEMTDIAREVGLNGARSAITTYHRCKKKLIAQIEDNVQLKQLLQSYL